MSTATRHSVTMTREEWLDKRAQLITATDVAKIAGLSPWGGPLDVYMAKRGLLEVEETPAMRLGRRLHPVVLDLYEAETGEGLRRYADTELVIARDIPWAAATPDAETLDVAHKLVEAKTAGPRQAQRWGDSGTDDVPQEYLCQVQWQMLATGAQAADLAVLLAGHDFRIYRIQRHDGLIRGLVSVCERFRDDHLVPGIPPAMDASMSAREYLRATYPRELRPELLAADEKGEMLAMRLHEARTNLAEAQNIADAYEAQMKAEIGEAAGIEGRLWRATWKATKDTSTTDWKELARHALSCEQLAELEPKFTTVKAGARRFTFKFNGESNGEG